MSKREREKGLSVLSMGWGVQTWTLAAMMALGEHERADYIVFADTHHEGQATYEFRAKWEPWLGEHGLDVVTVESNRTEATRDDWNNSVLIPAFTLEKGSKRGQTQRQCTGDWKIAPIRRWVRGILAQRGIKNPPPGSVESWQGISWDESYRMGDSDVKYIVHRYPLIDLRMTRMDCIQWCETHNLPVAPRSSCSFCPFHTASEWVHVKRSIVDWREAMAVDAAIRHKRPGRECYVHPARKPLPKAVHIPEDEGAYQTELDFCEGGYCHV
jgi:hypothetical protein